MKVNCLKDEKTFGKLPFASIFIRNICGEDRVYVKVGEKSAVNLENEFVIPFDEDEEVFPCIIEEITVKRV